MRILLPSNSSLKNYPQNTLSKFTVQLPQPIDLTKGRYECGLAEIQFLRSWYNVQNAYINIGYQGQQTKVIIKDGFYKSPGKFVDYVNEEVKRYCSSELSSLIEFVCDNNTRKCNLKVVSHKGISLDFSPSMNAILGFDDLYVAEMILAGDSSNAEFTNAPITIPSNHPIRLNSIFNLMVYTDIAESSIIGDVEAPLLRVVPVEEGHWKYQCTTFNKIQYVPVSRNQLRSITMYIYTDYGEFVPFTDGRTIVTLDIRRVKPIHTY